MKKYKIELPGASEIVKRFGLGPGGITQKFFTNELARISDNYAPLAQGALKNSARQVDNGTAIEYRVPYARVHWYGKVMAGSLPKQPTERNMIYRGSPTRGSKWVERAYMDNKEGIIKATEKKAKEQRWTS